MIKDLSEKLKERRCFYGLSQREVANRINVSPSVISGYETGERTPSVEVIISLAHLYKCSADYLLGLNSVPQVLTANLEGLSDTQARLIVELVETMKEK